MVDVKVGEKTIKQLSKRALEDAIAANTRIATDAADASTRKVASRTAKEGQRNLNQVEQLNAALKDAQLAGATLDDMVLAPTLWEQARKGQRALLGFTREEIPPGLPPLMVRVSSLPPPWSTSDCHLSL